MSVNAAGVLGARANTQRASWHQAEPGFLQGSLPGMLAACCFATSSGAGPGTLPRQGPLGSLLAEKPGTRGSQGRKPRSEVAGVFLVSIEGATQGCSQMFGLTSLGLQLAKTWMQDARRTGWNAGEKETWSKIMNYLCLATAF